MSTIDNQTDDVVRPTPAMTATELSEVVLTVDDGVATLRLGQPDEVMVTLTEARIGEIESSIAKLAAMPDLRGVIITGPGPDMFCAGADVNLIRDITEAADGTDAAVRGRSVFAKLRELKVPVVAAIEGPCLGGGLELGLFCDVRVASAAASTQIGLPEVKLGIVPGFGGTQNLTRLVGLPKALELILAGKLLRGQQAQRERVVTQRRLAQRARPGAQHQHDEQLRLDLLAPRQGFAGAAGRRGSLAAHGS